MRSTSVSPSATRPASTSEAEARRSVAITGAPAACRPPLHHGRVAFQRDVRAQRTSSGTCMKRFSKIVSMMVPVPSAIAVQRHELRLHVGREGRIGGGAC
jgi:hypothetical protein